MTGLFLTAPLFRLQATPAVTDFAWEGDPRQAIILLIVIGVAIVVGITFNILRNGLGISFASKGGIGGKAPPRRLAPRKFSSFTLHRIASSYGLERKQRKLLDFIFRNDGVSDPQRVMKNTPLMDRHFKRAYRTIEKTSATEEDAQEKLLDFFSLRNVIEASAGLSDSTAPRLSENTPAVLGVEKDSYNVKIISSRGRSVVTEIPRNSLGSTIRLKKGTEVLLSFFTKSSEGFSLDGQIVGSLDTDRGHGLEITHTGKLKRLVKRMYRRKQVDLKCIMNIVNLQESEGKKAPPKMVLDSRKFAGTVLDISAGGCALKTTVQIQAGTRLKISIDFDEHNSIYVLGQVLRINRSQSVGSVLHIKFLKVPRRAYNAINALAYGYVDM